MKPIRLELRGFTAFRHEAVVEFAGRHLFAITGPTGAGKSSLLDAMTWVLYGQVPRVGNQVRQLMSHGAQEMRVLFEFSVRGQSYRVGRQIGQKTAARLERALPDGRWEPLADRVREVASGVEAVLGLDYATFTKTVLLPQGAFDAFLRGEPGERRDILSGLLGLGRYDSMGREARARATGARAAVEMQRQHVERLDLATPEAIAALHAERATQETRLHEAERRRLALAELAAREREASDRKREATPAADAAHTSALALVAAQDAMATARQAATDAATLVAALAAERAALAYDPEAHRALQQRVAQAQQREAAHTALAQAERALAAAVADAEAASKHATEAERATTRQQADAAGAATQFATARTALLAAATPALAATGTLRDSIEAAERERAEAEALALTDDQRARDLDTLAQRARTVFAEHERADAEALRTTASAAQAEASRLAAHAAEAEAQTRVEAATREREMVQRAHAAAALRRDLVVGDLCPVCGEPITALATHDVPNLDAADHALAAAQAALTQARATEREAAEHAATARARGFGARTLLASVAEQRAAIEAACAIANVASTDLARAIEDANAAGAAARAHALAASARAVNAAAAERALSLLLAACPPEVQLDHPSPPRPRTRRAPPDIEQLQLALREVLSAYSARATDVRAAENAARAAAEAARASSAAAEHAQQITTQAAATAEAARERLRTLGGEAAADDAQHLNAAIADADARAARVADLDTRERAAGEGVVSAETRAAERARAAEAAALAAAASNAALVATEALATAAREAYATRWQVLLNGSAAPGSSGAAAAPVPDERTLAGYVTRVEMEQREASERLGALGAQIEAAQQQREQAERLRGEIAQLEQSGNLAHALEQELRRDHFVAYVQREAMQLLAAEAAERMDFLSHGRYRLRSDGDEFIVVDRLNGDERRSVKTLSGGETFLASLALALALSDQLPRIAGHGGALALESLFIDEGFGSLDADALDVAIEALELLASGDRLIGVISHVGTIAERLPDRIEVIRAGGVSHVR